MTIQKVGVVGAGTMGRGIVEMLAEHEIFVILIDKTQEALLEAQRQIELSFDKKLEKWAITLSEKKMYLSYIQYSLDVQLLHNVDLVIESVTEDLELKKKIFKQLDQLCPPQIVLASNTSALSLTEIAAEAERPERIIGMHFLHPVSKVNLVEIIRALKTSDEIFTKSREFVERIEKVGIQVYESPGFVTSRLILTLINEAMLVLMEGVASAEDIDLAMKIGYDFGKGPFEMADRFGLDSVLAAMEYLFHEYGDPKFRPSPMLRKLVRAGQLGVKSGEGFFTYDENGERIFDKKRAVK